MTRDTIVAGLAGFPERLSDAAAGFDAVSAARRPASGEWSVIELACHIRDYMEIFNSRIERALAEENPRVQSYDNADLSASREYASQDLTRVLTVATGVRRKTLDLISRMGDAGWARTVEHPTWGRKSIEWLLQRCADHDAEHVEDIRRREVIGT